MTVEVRPEVLEQIAEVHAIAERLRELAVALRADGVDVRVSMRLDSMGMGSEEMDARVVIAMDTQMRSIPR